jgi:Flp pilus assembly pilin Flp
VIARTDAWLNSFTTDEEGSQALEAAGAALAAMAIVALLRGGAGILGKAVKAAFETASSVIGG